MHAIGASSAVRCSKASAINDSSMKNDFDDFVIGLNILARILAQQQEIGSLATLHRANLLTKSRERDKVPYRR
jgi:hypothetical protein